MSKRVWVAEANFPRLDVFVAQAGGLPRREARRLLDAGLVFVDGRRVKVASKPVYPGQRVLLHDPEPTTESVAPVILHEDDDLLVVNKPVGFQVNESETTPRLSVWAALGGRSLAMVHRLDRDTSGVLLFSKNVAATRALGEAFRERRVRKQYWAVVSGEVTSQTVDAAIGPDPKRPRARRIDPEGKSAQTRLVALGHEDGLTGLQAWPTTGRTHQIRLHVAHLGAPILGDLLYGGQAAARFRGEVVQAPRMLLHARALWVALGAQEFFFEAPPPDDFSRWPWFG